MKSWTPSFACFGMLVVASLAWGQQEKPTPDYNTRIPPEIMTPDRVDSQYLGTLEFSDGRPSAETADKIQDHLAYLRGVEVFLNLMPACSIEAMRAAHSDLGFSGANQVAITEDLMDSNPLFLTGNTDTVYASAILDLKRDGPTVVEIPPACGPGTVNDAFFRFVVDMGAPGPDRGKGGKYLILPPDFQGLSLDFPVGGRSVPIETDGVPENYFVVQSPSYTNWLILRGFLVDGKPDAAVRMFREGLKIYPLKDAADPPAMEFRNISGVPMNTIHANNEKFYDELNNVIQREPIGFLDPELRGMAASLGIEKGKPFQPDARMQEILKESAAVGNAAARTVTFDSREPGSPIYPDSQWRTAFIGGDYRWLRDGGTGGRNQDARTAFFYFATVNTPAMAAEIIGAGSQYACAFRDQQGRYLAGNSNYTLTIPANVPARDFWSVVVYDPQTRSELQTSQPFPSVNNQRNDFIVNDDGSVTLYFGPEAPAGKEQNWIQTVPEKGWFAILRLYGPLEPWYDKSWQPGEIQRVD